MYTSDPSLVRALHPGLLSILKVVEPSPQKSKFGRKVKFNVIFFALFFYSYIFGSVSTEKHSFFFEKEKEVTSLTCDSSFPDASIMHFCPHTWFPLLPGGTRKMWLSRHLTWLARFFGLTFSKIQFRFHFQMRQLSTDRRSTRFLAKPFDLSTYKSFKD